MVQPELRDALFIPSDSRDNFKTVIAKRSDLVQFDRGRLGPSQYGVYLYAGQVLGLAATGADAGYYKPYIASNTDGSQVAVAVLAQDANCTAPASGTGPGDGSEIVMIKEGVLFYNALVGIDAAGVTALGGHQYTEGGTALIRIRA